MQLALQALGIQNWSSSPPAEFLLGWGDPETRDEHCAVSRRWFVWGQGDMQRFAGNPSIYGYTSGFDGTLSTAYLGIDARLGSQWLVGIALSRSRSAGEWMVSTSGGRLTQSMIGVYPYVRWAGRSLSIWTSVGAGRGDVHNRRNTGRIGMSPSSLQLGLIEFKKRLGAVNKLGFAIVGDAGLARLNTEKNDETVAHNRSFNDEAPAIWRESIDDHSVVVNQVRIGVDLALPMHLGRAKLKTFGTVHGRHDGGAGQTGSGIEISGGFQIALHMIRLDAQARTLAYHSVDGYNERGVSLTLTFGERRKREGFSFEIAPQWGSQPRSTHQLFQNQSLHTGLLHARQPDRWMIDAHANYAIRLLTGFKLNLRGSYDHPFSGPGFGISLIYSDNTGTSNGGHP